MEDASLLLLMVSTLTTQASKSSPIPSLRDTPRILTTRVHPGRFATRHVSSTTTPRRLQWKLPSSRHSMARSCISSTYIHSSSVHAHTHMYTPASVFSCIELARPLPHSSAARAEASHTKLPQHASTGSQSSTLKSTRSTFRSPDRLWGLSS
jgi:hypothetical protein